ncbi:MAG: hypothetical protein AAGL49_07570 [Pseudomonadota bacterium]
MPDILLAALSRGISIIFIAYGVCGLALFTYALAQVIWTDSIRPRFIPSTEIEGVAEEIIREFNDPELEAFARHEQAWYRGERAEQTYWLRVRKAVRRRLASRELGR